MQYSVDYWLGFIYFNSGNFLNTFKVWRKYIENADRAFDATLNKVEKIRGFLKQYEILNNSINDFKKNLQFVKRYTVNSPYKIRKENPNLICSGTSDIKDKSFSDNNSNNYIQNTNSSLNNKNNFVNNKFNIINQGNFTNITNNITPKGSLHETNNTSNINRLNYYYDILHSIKEIEPNLIQNKFITYEFYKACSIFYVESNL